MATQKSSVGEPIVEDSGAVLVGALGLAFLTAVFGGILGLFLGNAWLGFGIGWFVGLVVGFARLFAKPRLSDD